MEQIEAIPERLKALFERMNLSPEEQRDRWRETIDRQNERHAADEAYRTWLRANRLSDDRYPAQMAAVSLGITYADLGTATIEQEALACLSLEVIKRFNVFPWKIVDSKLYLAVADVSALRHVEAAANLPVIPVLTSSEAIQYQISRHFAA